jgi:spermidine synthase
MLVMTPPAIAMGATLPLLIASTRNHPEDPDHPARVGQIYAANTIGGVIGAFTAGFILLEKLQVVGAALVAILLNLIAVVVLVQRKRVAMIPVLGLLLWVWPPTWDPMVMSTGVYKYVTSLDNPSWSEMRRKMLDRYELLYYKEGLSSVVTVARNRLTGNIWLANNGKIDASTTADMPTQVLVTHLPFLFLGAGTSRPPPEKAQLIGLASGITLGALTLHRELKDLQVVEIEPGMPEAAQIFSSWHHDALSDPRVQLLANDGRNQLLLTPEKSLDLVISEPSNPWLTGVANLFTYEFFQMGKSRLIDGGVWSQWVQMYGMDPTDLRAILHTFTAVYRYVRVFATIEDADLVLVGSDAPLVLDAAAAARLLSKNVGVESELAQVGVHSVEDLLMLSLMDEEAISRLVSAGDKPTRLEAPLNTDNNLLVEYSAPRNLQRSTTEENMKMLAWFAQVPETVSTPDALLALGQSYQRRGDTVRALAALQRAVLLEPDREDLQDWRDAYKAIILTP